MKVVYAVDIPGGKEVLIEHGDGIQETFRRIGGDKWAGSCTNTHPVTTENLESAYQEFLAGHRYENSQRGRKEKCEEKITAAIREFEEATGLFVWRVDTDPMHLSVTDYPPVDKYVHGKIEVEAILL